MVYEALIISTGLGWLAMRAFPPLETDSKRSLCFSWRFHLELLMAGSDNPHFGSPPRGWTRSRAFYQSKVLRMHYWMRKVFEWRQSLRPCGVLKVRGTPCPRFCFKRRNYWHSPGFVVGQFQGQHAVSHPNHAPLWLDVRTAKYGRRFLSAVFGPGKAPRFTRFGPSQRQTSKYAGCCLL